jgi:hypothetical protein
MYKKYISKNLKIESKETFSGNSLVRSTQVSLTNEGVKTIGKIAYCGQCCEWTGIKKGEELIILPCGHSGKVKVVDVLGGITEIFAVDVKRTLDRYLTWDTD